MPAPEAADTSTANLGSPTPSMDAPQLDQLAVNEEYGVRAFFPRGAAVCEARSWQHPIGFYMFLGEQRECGHPFDPPVARFAQVLADYNAHFAISPKEMSPCPDGRLPAGIIVDLRGLVLQDMPSFACASAEETGRITVAVSALGGGPSIEPAAQSIHYTARLSTRAEHLDEDFAFFRVFVRELQFVPPE